MIYFRAEIAKLLTNLWGRLDCRSSVLKLCGSDKFQVSLNPTGTANTTWGSSLTYQYFPTPSIPGIGVGKNASGSFRSVLHVLHLVFISRFDCIAFIYISEKS